MTTRGLVLFVSLALAWGIPYLLIRVAVAEVTPAFLVFARTALAALILLPIALLRVDLRPVLRHWRWVVAFAVIEIAVPWVLLGSAEQEISSSLAGLLIAGVPLVSASITAALGTKVGGRQLAGLLIGFAGVAVIAGGDFETSGIVPLLQVGVVVVCYAAGPFILSRPLLGVSSMGIMAVSLALVAVAYIPIALLQWPPTTPSPETLASIVILAVVCTAAAFLIFAALVKEIGPLRMSLITYVNPIVAAVLGVLILDEVLTPTMLAGFALAIVGSVLATRRPRPPAHEPVAVAGAAGS